MQTNPSPVIKLTTEPDTKHGDGSLHMASVAPKTDPSPLC